MAEKAETFAQRLRKGLDMRGLKQVELSKISGIPKSNISHYLKGDWEGKQDAVYALAGALNVSEAWLMGYDTDSYDWDSDPDARLANVYGPRWDAVLQSCGGDYSKAWQAWQEIDREQADEACKMRQADALDKKKNAPVVDDHGGADWKKRVGATPCIMAQVAPLLGTVRAGLPMYAEENIEGYIPIRQTDGAAYFWLNIRGDSMNAAGMDDGDQILVREQPEVENGEIAVVLVNGDEATVKTFRREGELVILTPRSLNPTHQPQIYDPRKVPIRVLGKVIECRKVY